MGDEDDALAWAAIRELHRRGGNEEFEAARSLLASPAAKERGRGVDILAQLNSPKWTLHERERNASAVLAALAGESDPAVISSMGVALGHLDDPRAVGAMLPYKDHADANVRLSVVMALSPHPDPLSLQTLVELSSDPDEEVRNWATFSLGTQLEAVDTPELREALVARLQETNPEIRGEALVGLALRKDPRVLEPLKRELSGSSVIILAVEAAEVLGDPSLLPLLVQLRDAPGEADAYFQGVLQDAIAALERQQPHNPRR